MIKEVTPCKAEVEFEGVMYTLYGNLHFENNYNTEFGCYECANTFEPIEAYDHYGNIHNSTELLDNLSSLTNEYEELY